MNMSLGKCYELKAHAMYSLTTVNWLKKGEIRKIAKGEGYKDIIWKNSYYKMKKLLFLMHQKYIMRDESTPS